MVAAGQQARWAPQLSLADAQVSWDFGDGSPATAFGPNVATSRSYASPGLYTVVLRMRGLNGTVSTHSFIQAVTASNLPTQRSRHSGPMALELRADGNHQVWTVNSDHNNVAVLATLTGVRRLIGVGTQPEALALSSTGVMAIVNKGSRNLMLYNAATAARLRTVTLPYASRPHGVVFSPDGATGYVALEATGQVARFVTATGALLPAIEVGGALRHLSISGDGRTLAASRFITPPLPGEGTANVDVSQAGGEVAFIDLAAAGAVPRVARTVVLKHSNAPDTAISGRGIPNYLGPLVMSPDETRALVPSKQDNILRGALRDGQPLDFQNTVRAVTSRVDMVAQQEVPGGRIDHDNASVASAAVYHPSGLYAFVTLETSRELVVLDVQQGLQLFRIDVGHAPQGVLNAADGRSVYVYNFMSRSVTEVGLADLLDFGQRRASVLRNLKTTDTVVAREAGKRLFNDARDPRLAADGYMSCASCHNEAGSDGRVWDLTHLGEGLRNTPRLRGRMGATHGNMHWTGNFDEVQDFESQIRGLAGGRGLMSDAQYFAGTVSSPLGQRKTGLSADLDALAAYVNGLTSAEDSPHRQPSGAFTAQGAAGQTLFTQKGCTSCHAGAPFTNSRTGALPDIGTLKASSGRRLGLPLTGLDVPSLDFAWATAPYLHDGSAATLEDAIRAHTRPALVLSATELTNLARYIKEIE